MKSLILLSFILICFCKCHNPESNHSKNTNVDSIKPAGAKTTDSFSLQKLDTTQILMKVFHGVKVNSRKEVLFNDTQNTQSGTDSQGYLHAIIHDVIVYKDDSVQNCIVVFQQENFLGNHSLGCASHVQGAFFYALHLFKSGTSWICKNGRKFLGGYGSYGGNFVSCEVEKFGNNTHFLKISTDWGGGGSISTNITYHFIENRFNPFRKVFEYTPSYIGRLDGCKQILKHIPAKTIDDFELTINDEKYNENDDQYKHPHIVKTHKEYYYYDRGVGNYITRKNFNH